MAKFIKLTNLHINAERIAWIDQHPSRTRVWFSAVEDDYVWVDETPEQILALIEGGNKQ